jgi:DUF4097 and DUF4098 domain-containing protein YvlB
MRKSPIPMLALLLVATAAAPTAPLHAQQGAGQRVDVRRPLAANGIVTINNLAGEVRVIGWDRQEVRVTGTLPDGVERVEVEGDRNRLEILVVWPRSERGRTTTVTVRGGAELEVHVPLGARVDGTSVSASYEARELRGDLRFKTTSGAIRVEGQPAGLVAETISGRILATGRLASVRMESISGRLELRGATGDVRLQTVSGEIALLESDPRTANLKSVSGSIRFNGRPARGATLDVESFSGRVELRLPADVSAAFEVSSFSGNIENQFGPGAQRTSRYTPERSLVFSTGAGDARINVSSFSGATRIIRDEG